MSRVAIITSQIVFFSGVVWSNLFYFKKPNTLNVYIYAIKICGTILIASNLYYSFTNIEVSSWQQVFGLFFISLSNLLFYWSIYINLAKPLSFAFTELESNSFRQTGPYKFIRHPIYAAYTYGWITGIILHKSWFLSVLSAFMFCLYYKASIAEEESLLSGPIKIEYSEYKKRTGFYWPKLF